MCGVGTIPLEASATCPMVAALAGDAEPEVVTQAHANGGALQGARNALRARGLSALPLHLYPRMRDAPDEGLTIDGQDERRKGSGGVAGVPAWHYEERTYQRVSAGSGVLSCTWDAMQLPLRPGCVDACIVDLPFGMTHKVRNGHTIQVLYERFIREAARVLHGGGRLVMLTPSRAALQVCLERQGDFWIEQQYSRVNHGGNLVCVCVWERTAVAWSSRSRQLVLTAAVSTPGRGC